MVYTKQKRVDSQTGLQNNKGILEQNEGEKAVVYGKEIPGRNFKSQLTLMVSRRQDLRQVGIDEFLCALRSFGIKKDELSGKTFKHKYIKDAPYKVQHYSTRPKREEVVISYKFVSGRKP